MTTGIKPIFRHLLGLAVFLGAVVVGSLASFLASGDIMPGFAFGVIVGAGMSWFVQVLLRGRDNFHNDVDTDQHDD